MKKVKLDEHQKIETPFQVPEGYFQELENRIQERISDRKRPVFIPGLRWALVPAMLVVIISGVWVVNNLQNPPGTAERMLAEVSNEEILTYLSLTDISESEIISLADQDVLLPEDQDYLEDIELGEEDLNLLIDQLGTESEYL